MALTSPFRNANLKTPNGDASAREAIGNTKVEDMPSAVSDLTTKNEKRTGKGTADPSKEDKT